MDTVPIPSAPSSVQLALTCSQCHQPIQPEWYFCANCGKKLVGDASLPLSTNITAQILLYGFSIVLPMIFYLMITRWQGIQYVKSSDPKAQTMGWIAIALIILSTILTGWYYTSAFNQLIQGATSTAGLSQYGI